MSTTLKDGGPAFPDDRSQVGMSLRDWFAGQALQGLLARDLQPNSLDNAHVNHAYVRRIDPETSARTAFKIADAMLAERAKNGNP